MYKNEFDNVLSQNKRFNAYMFYGQSTFLVEKYAAHVASLTGSSDDIEKIYFDDYNFKYAHDKLLQSSLFSQNNILLIKREKKLPKTEVMALIEACNTNPDSTVIFACLDDAEFKTMGGYFGVKTNSVSIRMFAPFPNEASRILDEEAKKLNVRADISALNHLYFMHRNDLSLAVNDLRKLAILNETISSKVIDQHCFGIGSVSLEDFLHNLMEGNDISKDLFFLLEEGMNEIYLLTQITAFVQQLYMISTYSRLNGSANAKEILGYMPPKPVWERKARLAISIKQEKFLEILEYLNDLELELKSSKIPDANIYIQACLRKFSATLR